MVPVGLLDILPDLRTEPQQGLVGQVAVVLEEPLLVPFQDLLPDLPKGSHLFQTVLGFPLDS